jgi:hypothetical protein
VTTIDTFPALFPAAALDRWEATARAECGAATERARVAVPLAGPWNDPALYAAAERAVRSRLGDEPVLAGFGVVVEPAGAPAVELGRACPPLYPTGDEALPAYAVTLRVPLSHRDAPALETLDGGAWRALPAGCAALVDHRVVRRALANPTARARLTLELVYARSWFVERRGAPSLRMSLAEYARVPREHHGLLLRVGSAIKQLKL